MINSTLERQKGKNMLRNPKIKVLVTDPNNVSRFIVVRGEVVEIVAEEAVDHANKQTQIYAGDEQKLFYGDISN